MKFSLTILLVCALPLISLSQTDTTSGQNVIKCSDDRFLRVKNCAEFIDYDEDQNAFFHRKSGSPFTGSCKLCYYNENLETYLTFANGRSEGQDTSYYENGVIKLIRSHYQGKEDGKWIFFNKDGTIKWEKSYYAGAPEGKHIYYFPDGNLYKIETWKAGQLTGTKKEFYKGKNGQAGKLKKEINYKNGEFDGAYRTYQENGQIAIEQFFKNGQKDGLCSYYYDDGKLFYTENYADGKREGQVKRLFPDGKTWIIERYKKGKKNGYWEEYYEDGTLKYEAKWDKGELKEEHFYNEDGDEIAPPKAE